MIIDLVDVLFGCTHRRYTFPIKPRGAGRHSAAAAVTGTYVVCLDCGKEFPYDWERMKVVSRNKTSRAGIPEPVHSRAA